MGPTVASSRVPNHRFLPDLISLEAVNDLRFLFRVYDTKSHCKLGAFGFVAAAFGSLDQSGLEAEPLKDIDTSSALAAAHVHWKAGGSEARTPWISTSARFGWAVWEMYRRLQYGLDGVCMAVITARLISGGGDSPQRKYFALHLLKYAACVPAQTEACSFANTAQEVLIYANIPKAAILCCISSDELMTALPLWFYQPNRIPRALVWDTPSYVPFQDARSKLVHNLSGRDWDIGTHAFQSFNFALLLLRDEWNRVRVVVEPLRDIPALSAEGDFNLRDWLAAYLRLAEVDNVLLLTRRLSLDISRWLLIWDDNEGAILDRQIAKLVSRCSRTLFGESASGDSAEEDASGDVEDGGLSDDDLTQGFGHLGLDE